MFLYTNHISIVSEDQRIGCSHNPGEDTMPDATTLSPDRSVQTSIAFLQDIFCDYHPRNFEVRLWNGESWEAETGLEPRFTLVLTHPGALRKMFWPLNELSLGEAYIHDDFDIEGDIESAFGIADYLLSSSRGLKEKIRLAAHIFSIPAYNRRIDSRRFPKLSGERHSRDRDRRAVTYHYDTSNDFFRCFLDSRMVYSCAYFRNLQDTLDAAQERKLDHICRKLRLKPGDRLLDIGCGWGGLVMHAAARYGAEAVGITVSDEQANLARERIGKAGLGRRCRVEVADYRDFQKNEGFQKIVSVGMFEHVGEAKLPEYFSKSWNLLSPGGHFLNHGISHEISRHGGGGPSFTDRYVFPDGELIPICTTLRVAEETGFEVRDVESLREHYALTLRHWVRNLEERRDTALTHVNETTWRIWRLYMAGSAHGFKSGRLNVYQSLLVKPDRGESGLPLTRDDWYA